MDNSPAVDSPGHGVTPNRHEAKVSTPKITGNSNDILPFKGRARSPGLPLKLIIT